MAPDAAPWDPGDWLDGLGLGAYAEAFRAHDVDAATLPLLTAEDLAAIGVASVGHRRRILAAAAGAAAEAPVAAPAPAERRILTVMFADLVGSTELAARLDVEEFADLLAGVRREVGDTLRAHGGHVAQLLGDGVMASFGYPASTDHAAERAVAAALAVQAGLAGRDRGDGPAVRLRIGIASGLAVVGQGSPWAAPGADTAIGETPNLAARLQAEAEPGTVVIADATRDLVGDLYDCEDLGARALRGMPGPVRLWRVRGRSRAATRFDALRDRRRRAPFTGRQTELDVLAAHLGRRRAGEAGVALVTGEAGFGKSRLVARAVRQAFGDAEPLVIQCAPYGASTPFIAIRYLLLAAAAPGEGGEDATRDRMRALLAAEGLDAAGAPLLAAVLATAPVPGAAEPGHDAAQARAALMRVLGDYLAARAARAGALVVEDANWLDASTAELVGELLPRLRAAGLPVVATSRPAEPLPSWLASPDLGLRLERLPPAEVSRLVAGMAGGAALPPAVAAAIAERSDGVPIFAEELARGYLEGALPEGAGADLARVPVTLAETLLARLDRLRDGRRLASVGAALGREFPVRLLAAVAGRPESAVRAGVAELLEAGILEPGRSRFGEAVRFRHLLMRDAAYDLLLHREQAPLHARIADVLETDFPEIAESLPHIVALQRDHAGQWARSRGAWAAAGRAASGRSGYAEAAEAYTSALAALGREAAGPERDEEEMGLRLSRLAALVSAQGYRSDAVDADIGAVVEIGARLGSPSAVAPALHARWIAAATHGDAEGARDLAEQALAALRSAGEAERLLALRMAATSHLFTGELPRALELYGEFLELFDPDRHRAPMQAGHTDHELACLVGLAEVSALMGDDGVADAWRARAFDAAQRSGRVHDQGLALTYAGCFHAHLMGRPDEVARHAAALADLTARHALPNWEGYRDLFDGLAAIRRGGDGVAALRRGTETLLAGRHFGEWWLVIAAGGFVEAGEWDAAQAAFDQAEARVRRGWRRVGPAHHRIGARLLGRAGRPEEARARAAAAEALAAAQGARAPAPGRPVPPQASAAAP